MSRYLGALALLCAIVITESIAQPPAPGMFSATTDKATGGKLVISAEGKVTFDETNYEIIGAFLKINPSLGGNAPAPVVITNIAKGGAWSVKDAKVPAGIYDVYCYFEIRKKNPQIGDVSQPVASVTKTGIIVNP